MKSKKRNAGGASFAGSSLSEAEQIREAALRILDFGDCSRRELMRKLQKKSFAAEPVARVVDDLTEAGLVDDARYAENYTRSAMERGKGPAWIRSKLLEKGVASDDIRRAAEELDLGGAEKTLCLRKALALCDLAGAYEVTADGRLEPAEDAEYTDERLDYFGRRIPADTDRFAARQLREKEKARLFRRLSGAGFSAAAVTAAVQQIEGL